MKSTGYDDESSLSAVVVSLATLDLSVDFVQILSFVLSILAFPFGRMKNFAKLLENSLSYDFPSDHLWTSLRCLRFFRNRFQMIFTLSRVFV